MGFKCSHTCPGRLNPGKEPPSNHRTTRWVSPTVDITQWKSGKSLVLVGNRTAIPRSSNLYPSHYAYDAGLANNNGLN
jgi:photosystem II stability/assembly factor-like uncharacterized protein